MPRSGARCSGEFQLKANLLILLGYIIRCDIAAIKSARGLYSIAHIGAYQN